MPQFRRNPPCFDGVRLVCRHRDILLHLLRSLCLRLNAQKSVLTPSQQTTFLGVQLDSLSMQACLAPARVSMHASGAHDSSLSCAAFGSPSYETIPVVDETQGHPPFLVCLPSAMSVAQFPSCSLEVERHSFFASRGQDGRSLLSPGCHNGRFFDRLGCRLRGQTGMWCLDW